MRSKLFSYLSAGLVSGVLWSSPDAMGQETRDPGSTPRRASVENADLLSVGDSAGTPVQRLIGNVRLRQGDTRLHADRAIRYEARGEILFVGNVVVFERGDTLFADRVLYRESTKVSRATGRVRLSDGEVRVTAPSAVYYSSEKYTEFREGVHLVDSTTVLASERGTYWSEEKRAAFSGRVRLTSEDVTVHADSLSYERETEVSIATGDVFVYALRLDDSESADTTSVTAVVAGWAYTDPREGLRRMRDDVLLFQVRFDSSKTDTLLLKSDILHVLESENTESMFATGDVSIWNMETAARADSVTYVSRTDNRVRREQIQFSRNPVVWYQDSQVSGDSIWIASTGGEPDTLVVRGRTFLAERDSVLQRVHQVRGANLNVRFLSSGRRRMVVSPNAEALYFLDRDGVADGAVRTSADRIIFAFENDQMKHVRAEGGVEGTYFPEAIFSDQNLDGFQLHEDKRPVRSRMLGDPRLNRAARLGTPLLAVRTNQSEAQRARVPVRREPKETGPAIVERHDEADPSKTWRPGSIDKSQGGYTLVVSSRPDRQEAESLAAEWSRKLVSEGLEVDLLRGIVDGMTHYRVVVGQYNTLTGARRVRRSLAVLLPEETWILRVRSSEQAAPGRQPTPRRRESAIADTLADAPDMVSESDTDWRPGLIDKSRGGYTLVVSSRTDLQQAEWLGAQWARKLTRERLEVDLFRGVVDGVTQYRVGVGRYNTLAGARRALRGLADLLPEGTWILRIRRTM